MEQDIRQAVEKWITDEWFSHNKDEHDDFVNFVAARVTENGCSEHPETYLNEVDIEDEYEGKYYVDAGPEQPDYPFMTEDEVCEFVEKHYQTNVNSIEDCQAFAAGLNENGDDDEFLYINAMEVEG